VGWWNVDLAIGWMSRSCLEELVSAIVTGDDLRGSDRLCRREENRLFGYEDTENYLLFVSSPQEMSEVLSFTNIL
jgi:hypothetical protein